MIIHLDPNKKEALYSQLYQAIKNQIHSGHLAAHQKLPSKRQLAKDLGISLNTVINAYEQLSLEGYLETRPRQGYFVADVRFQVQLTSEQASLTTSPNTSWRYDLTKAETDPSLFPYEIFRKLYTQRFDSQSPDLLEPSSVQGLASLRSSLASYLATERGVPCQPDQLILGPNAQALFQILVQLLPPNRRIGIEDPGYHAQLPFLKEMGWQVQACPLDQLGLSIEEIPLDQLDILSVTPTHQFPTGSVMPLTRRQAILDWARQSPNRWIIEDDYDSQFKYTGRPIPSLAQLDQGNQVIYMGSLSRILSPGLRISYMVLPASLLSFFYQKEKQFAVNLNTISQYAIHDFIQQGHLERHLNRARSFYKRKRDRLINAIEAQDPQAQLIGLDAGLHLLIQPSFAFHSQPFLAQLAQEGIRLKTLADFSIQAQTGFDQQIFLSFSGLPMDEVDTLINDLYQALRQHKKTTKS